MKKIFLAYLSLMMTVGLVTTVNAQTPVSFGVKAEANLSNHLLSHLGDQTSRMKVGPTLGGFMNIGVHKNFSIQPELMFSYRQSRSKTGIAKDDFRQWGVQLPVYFLGQTSTPCGKFYAGVGPYVGFGLDARFKGPDKSLYKKHNGKTAMNRWDFGFGVQIGHEFFNSMQINAGYQIGLVDQLSALKKSASKHTQSVSLGLGYRF
jgi:hypothetical protein